MLAIHLASKNLTTVCDGLGCTHVARSYLTPVQHRVATDERDDSTHEHQIFLNERPDSLDLLAFE